MYIFTFFSFLKVLKCISQLELAQLIGTGVKYNQSSGGGKSKDKRSANMAPTMDTFDPEGLYDMSIII